MTFKDKLQEYALIAEIISAAAIVSSLIFVGYQIRLGAEETRLNTQSIELGIAQTYAQNLTNIDFLLVQDEEAASLLIKARRQELSDIEQMQINLFYRASFREWDNAFYQLSTSGVDSTYLDRLEAQLSGIAQNDPLLAQQFARYRSQLSPQFIAFMEQFIDNSE